MGFGPGSGQARRRDTCDPPEAKGPEPKAYAKISPVSAGHFVFIPAVMIVGLVIGWILGSRAARDAYLAELRRREQKAQRTPRTGS